MATGSSVPETMTHASMKTPFEQSYWVLPGLLLAGQYPGDPDPVIAELRIKALVKSGVRAVVNLMEAEERDRQGRLFFPYHAVMESLLKEAGEIFSWRRMPIRDMYITTHEHMRQILDEIDHHISAGVPVYVHCWGGVGRTGTVVGCYLARHGIAEGCDALSKIADLRSAIPFASDSPETNTQRQMVLAWQKGQ